MGTETTTKRKVTPEEHKLMVKYGIKVRDDGRFGFKLKCARSGCDVVLEEVCYARDTLDDAILDIEINYSSWYHSKECMLDDQGVNVLLDGAEMEDFAIAIFDHFGVPNAEEDEIRGWHQLPDDWFTRLRAERPELWEDVNDYIDEGDYDLPENHAPCEV